MDYKETKVYFDGSHYIGIPHTTQGWKKKKHKSAKTTEEESKVKEMLNDVTSETKQEKKERIVNELNEEIKDIEKTNEIVNKVIEKDKRNRIVRLTRLSRKVGLQQWTHFCTFTYDSTKLTEEQFRVKFLNCLSPLSAC